MNIIRTIALAASTILGIVHIAPALTRPADFNNDGFDDLAIGAPGESIGGHAGAGQVHVMYGSGAGLDASGGNVWNQNRPGIAGTAESGDHFGSALAWGDFNGDGFDDLAIGAHGQKVNGVVNAGGVHVLFGSAAGLTSQGDQFWNQNSPGFDDSCSPGDHFGYALAAGDFNGDGFADLAIGVPGEGFNGINQAGIVHVLFGSSGGLSASGEQTWSQNSPGIEDSAQLGDQFGRVLAAGDMNGDGVDDLAIGVPFEDHDGMIDAGVVHVLYGGIGGLTAVDSSQLHQDDSSDVEHPEAHDLFGSSLAIGDFNNDGYGDLAVGVMSERVGSVQGAGAVEVFYGHDGGIEDQTEELWSQNTAGIAGNCATNDFFGGALTVGDFNHDGFVDLAIGAPGEDVGGIQSAGAVHVIFGSGLGLTAAGDQFIHENSAGVPGSPTTNGRFGAALSSGDFDGDGFADLVIGMPWKRVSGFASAGAIDVAYGHAGGIAGAAHQLWHQNVAGIPDSCSRDDLFGASMGAALYDMDGLDP